MNARVDLNPDADVGALSIYLMRDATGAIVVNPDEVEQFAQAGARKKVAYWEGRRAEGTLGGLKVPTFDAALAASRNWEAREAAIKLSQAIADAAPGREMTDLEYEFLMSGKYTRD